MRLCFSVVVWTPVFALAFLSVYMDSCVCAYVSWCLHRLLCLWLRFLVFVWILALALAFLGVCINSFACACVPQCLYGPLGLTLAFPGVHVDYCACTCVSQCLYGLLCLRFPVCVWTLAHALAFISVCMDYCA